MGIRTKGPKSNPTEITVSTIPRNESGKIPKQRANAMYNSRMELAEKAEKVLSAKQIKIEAGKKVVGELLTQYPKEMVTYLPQVLEDSNKSTNPATSGVGKKGFQPGNRHGKGRAEGSRTNAQATLLAITEAAGMDILNKMIKLAKAGDMTAARFLMERCLPVMKGRRIILPLTNLSTMRNISEAFEIITLKMAEGEITPEEGEHASNVVSYRMKAYEVNELAVKLDEMIDRMNKHGIGM